MVTTVAFARGWQTTTPISIEFGNDLTVEIQATMTTPVRHPQQAGLSLRVPVERLTLLPEVGFEGWSSWSRLESSPSNVQVGSSDPILDEILAQAGLQVTDLIRDPEITTNGTENLWWGGLGMRMDLEDDWQLISGAWVVPAVVPDARVHPSNLDFGTLDLRGGVRRAPLALTADVFLVPDRRITRSAWTGSSATGETTASGNGVYTFSGARLGLTWTPVLGR